MNLRARGRNPLVRQLGRDTKNADMAWCSIFDVNDENTNADSFQNQPCMVKPHSSDVGCAPLSVVIAADKLARTLCREPMQKELFLFAWQCISFWIANNLEATLAKRHSRRVLNVAFKVWVEEARVFPPGLVDSSESDDDRFTGGLWGGASSAEDDDTEEDDHTDRTSSEGSFYDALMWFVLRHLRLMRTTHASHPY